MLVAEGPDTEEEQREVIAHRDRGERDTRDDRVLRGRDVVAAFSADRAVFREGSLAGGEAVMDRKQFSGNSDAEEAEKMTSFRNVVLLRIKSVLR